MEKKKEGNDKEEFTSEEIAEEIDDNNKSLYRDINRKDEDAKKRTTGGF